MTLSNFLSTSGPFALLWGRVKTLAQDAGRQDVVDAFEIESRLPMTVWAAVWAVLPAALANGAWEDVENAARGVFQSHTRKAPPVLGAPSPKGRAITADRLLDLMREAGLIGKPEDEEQFLSGLRTHVPPTLPYDRQLYDCPLGAYSIWSTFDDHIAGGDPFDGCTSSAATVRHAFGLLDPISPSEVEMVLCIYRLPTGEPVHAPTIADAYAGDTWNPRYRASNPADRWGYTSGGRPEVVHCVIPGRHLSAPTTAPAVSPLRLVS